ncbi:transcriptional regulator, Cro/CI family [Proteiniborus sp. DW1]|uniref:helix-turn-helix domain-containing protein n=1 Tax=Proteiniborus sp. DW1 TaxID=1889883 RepID=UPI00092DF696|nr:helix-turn-helix domain-containing protein [Proteiniborus sp. DW1]SCG82675.1 transcriptional regulator, Cro/CI family [Proteiniborus sp. DW1]
MDANDIKDIIKNRRIELGLTQLDIAKAVGVSEATVSRWESGDIGDMKRSRIATLAKVLRISPNVIMGWKDEDDFQLGNLLVTYDDELIAIINKITNLPQNKSNIKSIINDILEMDEKQLEQLKKLIIVIKSNILD